MGDRIGKFRRPIKEILNDFAKPIPERLIKVRPIPGGGKHRYIEWQNYVRLLEYYAPGYDWQINVKYLDEFMIVEGKLTIKAAEGDFVRQALGQESTKPLEEKDKNKKRYGDPPSNAEASALKRCCAKFGLGLCLE